MKQILRKTVQIAALFALMSLPFSLQAEWTEVDIPGNTQRPQDLVYYNGLYIAVGYNAEIITSSDGITWELEPTDAEPTDPENPEFLPDFRAVAASETLVVAVGDSGIIASSTNGMDWEIVQQGVLGGTSYQSIAYGDGLFVATTSSDTVVSYQEGDIWRSSLIEPNISTRNIVFLGDQFLVTPGSGNDAYIGTPGGSWQLINSGLSSMGFVQSLDFSNDAVYAGGNSPVGAALAFATDSSGFVTSTLNDGAIQGYVHGFAGDGDIVVAVGGNFFDPSFGFVLYSEDSGLSYSLDTDELSHVATSIVYADGKYVLVGEGYAAYSDGPNGGGGGGDEPYLIQGAEPLGNDFYDTWIGVLNASGFPWVVEVQFGWFYAGVEGNTNDASWFYFTHPSLQGWFWASEEVGPVTYGTPVGMTTQWWYVADEETEGYFYFFGANGEVVIGANAF